MSGIGPNDLPTRRHRLSPLLAAGLFFLAPRAMNTKLIAWALVVGFGIGSVMRDAMVVKLEEEVAPAGRAGDRRLADPSRPPVGFEEDCARSARQFLAWREDGEEWQYACVNAWLARPEVILAR